MGWALTLGTKIIQILGSYIRDRREYSICYHCKDSGVQNDWRQFSFYNKKESDYYTIIEVISLFILPQHEVNASHLMVCLGILVEKWLFFDLAFLDVSLDKYQYL